MGEDKQYIRVYVAGSLRGNFLKKKINIYRAKKVVKWLWKRGIAVYSPHMNSGWIDSPETDKFVVPANLDFMYSCDVLLAIGKWYNSMGTIEEIEKAYKISMPVYYDKVSLYKDILNKTKFVIKGE
jgi:hypothetical protein